MKKEKKFFNFKENDYKSKLLDIYPYQATNDLGIVYIEKCKVLALEADYYYRKPIKFDITLETQTKGTINIFSFGEHLDIVDFFPCPKHFDEVIAVLVAEHDRVTHAFLPQIAPQNRPPLVDGLPVTAVPADPEINLLAVRRRFLPEMNKQISAHELNPFHLYPYASAFE